MIAESSQELAVLEECNDALIQTEQLIELTDIRSRAEAIRTWAKSANQSLEERKAGKLFAQMQLRPKPSTQCWSEKLAGIAGKIHLALMFR